MSEYQTPIPENPKPEHSGDCNVSDGVGDASAAEAIEPEKNDTTSDSFAKSTMPLTGPVLRRTLWREWRGSLLTFCFVSIYTDLSQCGRQNHLPNLFCNHCGHCLFSDFLISS